MSRQAITIPAAGVSQSFPLTGVTALIEFTNTYEAPSDVPLLGFNSGNNQFPIYPRARYQFDQGGFNNIVITGTSASAGDVVHILTVNECLGTHIPPEFSSSYQAIAGNTFDKTMDDTVQSIAAVEVTNAQGALAKSIFIANAGTGLIHYRWNDGSGTDPSIGGNDYVLLVDRDPIEILGIDFIVDKLRFINAVGLETPVLLITPRF